MAIPLAMLVSGTLMARRARNSHRRGRAVTGSIFRAVYNCSHDYAHPKYFRDSDDLIEMPGYEPEIQTDLALEFLHQNREQPFALFLSWGPPHDPYPMVPDEFRALYNEVEPRANIVEDTPNQLARGLEYRETLKNYYAAIFGARFSDGASARLS